jgi:hypothetical protein
VIPLSQGCSCLLRYEWRPGLEDLVRRCFNFLALRLIFPLLLTSMLDMNVAAVAYCVLHQPLLYLSISEGDAGQEGCLSVRSTFLWKTGAETPASYR